jgi:ABC-type dipeptide/oligopeptide/nickel transport system ATPase component
MDNYEQSFAGEELPCEIKMDGYLYQNFKFLSEKLRANWDSINIVVGKEGAGKTTLAMQMCLAMDPKFNIDRVVFNADQFDEAVDTCPKYGAVLWDEADDLSGNWASRIVQAVKSKMKRIRKNNLFIVLATPTFFDLGKYFAIHRADTLTYVYAKGLKRGYWRLYGSDTKRILYFKGKDFWNMDAVKSDVHGSFGDLPKDFPIDMGAYDDKKTAATEELMSKKDGKKVTVEQRRAAIRLLMENNIEMKNQDLATYFNVSLSVINTDRSNISSILKKSQAKANRVDFKSTTAVDLLD